MMENDNLYILLGERWHLVEELLEGDVALIRVDGKMVKIHLSEASDRRSEPLGP